jgi:hypothetical protein
MDLQLTNYHRKWLPAEEIFQHVISTLDGLGYEYAILGNYSQENSIRLANKFKAEEKKYLLVGYEIGLPEGIEYAALPEYLELVQNVPSLQNRTITLIKNIKDGKWQMYEGLWEKLP